MAGLLILLLFLWLPSLQGSGSSDFLKKFATCSLGCSSPEQHAFVKKVQHVLPGVKTIAANVLLNPNNASQKYAIFRVGQNDFFFHSALLDAHSLLPVWKPPIRYGKQRGVKSKYHLGKGNYVTIIDPRYFTFQSRHYFVFTSGFAFTESDPYRMNLVEIIFEEDTGNIVLLLNTAMTLMHATSLSQNIKEKNWAPFSYTPATKEQNASYMASFSSVPPHHFRNAESQLLMEYSMVPHQVMEITAKDVSSFQNTTKIINARGKMVESVGCMIANLSGTVWAGKRVRNGSPPILLPPNSGSTAGYLAFFHLMVPPAGRYVMGAFVFEAAPPFAITHISPEPIVARYGHNLAGHNKQIYPFMQYLSSDEYQHTVHVSVLRNTVETWVMDLDLQGLLASLIEVDSRPC